MTVSISMQPYDKKRFIFVIHVVCNRFAEVVQQDAEGVVGYIVFIFIVNSCPSRGTISKSKFGERLMNLLP